MEFVDPSKEHQLAVEVSEYKGLRWRGVVCLEGRGDNHQQYSKVKLLGYNQKGDQVAKMVSVS